MSPCVLLYDKLQAYNESEISENMGKKVLKSGQLIKISAKLNTNRQSLVRGNRTVVVTLAGK